MLVILQLVRWAGDLLQVAFGRSCRKRTCQEVSRRQPWSKVTQQWVVPTFHLGTPIPQPPVTWTKLPGLSFLWNSPRSLHLKHLATWSNRSMVLTMWHLDTSGVRRTVSAVTRTGSDGVMLKEVGTSCGPVDTATVTMWRVETSRVSRVTCRSFFVQTINLRKTRLYWTVLLWLEDFRSQYVARQ